MTTPYTIDGLLDVDGTSPTLARAELISRYDQAIDAQVEMVDLLTVSFTAIAPAFATISIQTRDTITALVEQLARRQTLQVSRALERAWGADHVCQVVRAHMILDDSILMGVRVTDSGGVSHEAVAYLASAKRERRNVVNRGDGFTDPHHYVAGRWICMSDQAVANLADVQGRCDEAGSNSIRETINSKLASPILKLLAHVFTGELAGLIQELSDIKLEHMNATRELAKQFNPYVALINLTD